jgi:CRP/FNR family transcriptional regulator, cyclic AMP receptor protein
MGTGDAKLDLLRTVSLFADLGRKDLEEVGRLADTVDVPADKVLMREGQSGAEMFVIASGSVVVERNGREVARLGQGDVVGEGALLSEGPRTATVTTAEPSTLFVLGHREFHTLLADSAEVRRCVFDEVARRLRTAEADRAH